MRADKDARPNAEDAEQDAEVAEKFNLVQGPRDPNDPLWDATRYASTMDVGTHQRRAKKSPRPRVIGRRRRLLGWLLLSLGVFFAANTVLSAFKWYGFLGNNLDVHVGRGTAIFEPTVSSANSRGFFIWPPEWEPSIDWSLDGGVTDLGPLGRWRFGLFEYGYLFGFDKAMTLLLWPLAVFPIVAGAGLHWWAWRDARRARVGLCDKCRYDLRGLPASAPCPECGKVRVAGVVEVGVASGDEGKGGA